MKGEMDWVFEKIIWTPESSSDTVDPLTAFWDGKGGMNAEARDVDFGDGSARLLSDAIAPSDFFLI